MSIFSRSGFSGIKLLGYVLRKKLFRKRARCEQSRRSQNFDGQFQPLEERRVLTAYTVNTLLDDATGLSDGLISFREAMIAAETNMAFGDAAAGDAAGDTIIFDVGLNGMTIDISGNGVFSITDDVSIGSNDSFVTIDAKGFSRLFNIDTGEVVSFSNFAMTGGVHAAFGGAVSLAGGGTLSMTDMLVSSNSAGADGGAIFSDDSKVIVTNSRFENNTATDGSGGAFYATEGSASFSGSTLSGNMAAAGGAVGVVDSNTSFTDSDVSNNTATSGSGGAIAGFGNSVLTVDSSSIFNNSSSLNGGGIWLSNGVNASLFVRNNSAIFDNTASGNDFGNGGGGIFNQGGLIRVHDSNVNNNSANGTFASGGGIFSQDGILDIRNSNLFSNQAAVSGGGIELAGGFARLTASVLGGAAAADANFAGLNTEFGDGGGIHVSGSAGTVAEIVSTSVSHNVALRDGGAIWNGANSTLVINSMSFVDNNIANSNINGGGAVFNAGGVVVIDNSTITTNFAQGSASLGGGILSLGGVVTIDSSSVNTNQANRAGGGIAMLQGALVINGGDISSNTTNTDFANQGDGGGIFIENGSYARLDNVNVVMNVAANIGGGIATLDSTLQIRNDSTVDDNSSRSQFTRLNGGGGIYQQGGHVRVDSSSVSRNIALGTSSAGGGIDTLGGRLVVNASVIAGNTASLSGGGIHVESANATIKDTTIGGASFEDGNFAISGGGFFIDGDATGWVNGGTISNNRSSGFGGGIYNQAANSLRVSGGATISNNTSDWGGGIYTIANLLVEDSAIMGNVAEFGGGLSVQNGAIAVVDTADIDGNEATFIGGGVQNAGILKFIDLGLIQNNTSLNTGGGIFTDPLGNTILGPVMFSNNTPDDTNP